MEGKEKWGKKNGELDTTAIESHSACPVKVVLRGADFLNGLLGHNIAGCEEHLLH